MKLKSERFEIVTTKTGAISIRNTEVNEIMHNPVGPWLEANGLYIEQSKLKAKLAEKTNDELVVFDVGLGAAANAVATLACARSLGDKSRPLRLISFERDLELLQFALDHASSFDHFKGFESALASILETGCWQGDNIVWELRHGNFLDLIQKETSLAHLIFFDPYSPLMNQEMWSTHCFTMVRAKCREFAAGGTSLYTYTLSTRVRVSLILAGFYVGHGKATGFKGETTEASTSLESLSRPLSTEWLNRYRRSHARHPFEASLVDQPLIDAKVEAYLARVIG